MRAGRVLDAGTPAELVHRYARTTTVRFTMPDPPAGLLDELRQLDGMRKLDRTGARVVLQGDRRIIAHVGASFVRSGVVPDDLNVEVPGLEDALLTLLEPGPHAAGAPATEHSNPTGGRR
jgi:hypothetical protein